MEITSRRMTPEEAERFRRDDAAFRKSNSGWTTDTTGRRTAYPDGWVPSLLGRDILDRFDLR